MSASTRIRVDDQRLLDEALVVVRDARQRAPSDFLIAIAVLLGGATLVLLAAAALAGGSAHDFLLNLSSEAIGALVTVVVIDGLWKRAETGASASLRAMGDRLQARRDAGTAMSDVERSSWRSFVDDYRSLTARETLRDRLVATRSFGRRAHDLEERGERTLRASASITSDPEGDLE